MKKILIIQAHPNKDSLLASLANAYLKGASKNYDVELVHLIDLDFDLNLTKGYTDLEEKELEPDLVMMQEKIKAADHVVWTYPNWWGTFPALLKGFIDRVLVPHFAFEYTDPLPVKLLKGRSSRLLVTMDSPYLWYKFIVGEPGHKAMKKAVLQFCGFKPIKITSFYVVRKADEKKIQDWLQKAERLGEKGV